MTVGPAAFEVVPLGNNLVIRVNAGQPLVKAISFVDQDKKVGAGNYTLILGADGKVNQRGQYNLPPNTKAVSISVTHYEKMESVTVPVMVPLAGGGVQPGMRKLPTRVCQQIVALQPAGGVLE